MSFKDSVRKRASNRCEKCGVLPKRNPCSGKRGSVHHRRPRRIGGPDTLSNCVLLCLECHYGIHADEITAALEGWIVWGDPEVTPVRLPLPTLGEVTLTWALLVPDGTFEHLSEDEGARLEAYVNSLHPLD